MSSSPVVVNVIWSPAAIVRPSKAPNPAPALIASPRPSYPSARRCKVNLQRFICLLLFGGCDYLQDRWVWPLVSRRTVSLGDDGLASQSLPTIERVLVASGILASRLAGLCSQCGVQRIKLVVVEDRCDVNLRLLLDDAEIQKKRQWN